MLKDKLKHNKTAFKIDPNLLEAVREYCYTRGIKITWYCNKAIEERLEKDNQVQPKITQA